MTCADPARRRSSATLSRIASRSTVTHAEAPAVAGSGAWAEVVMGPTSLGRGGRCPTQQVGDGAGDAVGDLQRAHRAAGVGPVGGDPVDERTEGPRLVGAESGGEQRA